MSSNTGYWFEQNWRTKELCGYNQQSNWCCGVFIQQIQCKRNSLLEIDVQV